MILMRGSILDEIVKKGVGGCIYFTYSLPTIPTRSKEKEEGKNKLNQEI